MEKIDTKKQLIERLKDTLVVEVTARDDYAKDILLFEDDKIVDTYRRIKLEEDEHIKMIIELISIIKK